MSSMYPPSPWASISNFGQGNDAFSMPSLNGQANSYLGIDPGASNPVLSGSTGGFKLGGSGWPGAAGGYTSDGSYAGGGFTQGGGSSWLDGLIGTKEAPGWGGMAVGGASALMGAFMGMKQYGLAKDQLEQNKKKFQMNYDAQKSMTNSTLEDRQRARVAANPGAYQSPGEYMSQYGIK